MSDDTTDTDDEDEEYRFPEPLRPANRYGHHAKTGFRLGAVVNDRAINARAVYVGWRHTTLSEQAEWMQEPRNQHFVPQGNDAYDAEMLNLVYPPDEGEIEAPSSVAAMPRARTERFLTEAANDALSNPLVDLQAQTIAVTVLELGTVIRPGQVEAIAPDEQTAELAKEYLRGTGGLSDAIPERGGGS